MLFQRFAACATLLFPLVLGAQDTTFQVATAPDTTRREAPHHVMVGSDDENYLRYLQDAGVAAVYPWSLREFSQKELATLAVKPGTHPWSGKGDYKDYPSRFSFKILPVNAVLRYNSAFPYGSNDGAVWAGRGLTSAIDLGFAFRLGPLSATVNPIAFRAENQAFQLQPTGSTGIGAFQDPQFGRDIDRPQRFGSSAYSRVDPGESTVRLDLVGLTAGISTANMGWGPMELYPYIIGANAPGFPHAFVGSSSPIPIGIGTIHGRVVWGELAQSAYSPVSGSKYYSSTLEPGTKRFMSGIVGTFEPRGIAGLEIGGARFFHSIWPRSGLPRRYFFKPFESILKNSLGSSAGFAPGSDADLGDNQLASVFARWAFPSSGFEVYGEYGHEDHNADIRDFIQEPDHSRTYGLGLRKILSADSAHLTAIRTELINYELPTLARHRSEGGIYVHSLLRQGHTNLGQVIGSDAGVGSGGASTFAWDRYDSRGRSSISWTRTIRAQDGTFFLNGSSSSASNDVSHALTVERVRFLPLGELSVALTVVREFNRYFQRDAWNVNSIVGLRRQF